MKTLDTDNVLITGADGMVGSYINFGIKTSRDTLDILDGDAVMTFVKAKRPSAIIHLAAATDTNRCEEDSEYAFRLNSVGTINVALAAKAVGAVLVYVSSSRVFDGDKIGPYTEDEIPNPKTVYGKSKYLGEVATSLIAGEYIIVRGCWIFGGGPAHDNKFYGNVLKQLGNETIRALGDVYGSPTYAKDFINGITRLLEENRRGIFHLSNDGFATRSDIVDFMLGHTKSKTKLEVIDRSYYPNGHVLPSNESISSEKIKLRSWQEALAEYINDEWNMDISPEKA